MGRKKTNGQNNLKLLDSTKRQIDGLSERLFEIIALYNLSKNLNVNLEIDNILIEAEKFTKHSLGINDFSILLLDEKGKTLTMWSANRTSRKKIKDISFKIGEGISGLVAKNGKPILVKDINQDSRYLHYKGKKTGTGSFYSAPLKNKNKKVIGVFNIHRNEVDGFKQSNLALFNEVALQIAQALEKSIIFMETRKLAITDDLTQLHSRRYFMDVFGKEISKAERNQSVFSLIMVDVDHFKSINDTYGHPVGDSVLKKLSSLLKSITRKGDIAARYGGEEFIILLPGASEEHAVSIAEKIRFKAEKYLTINQKNQSPRKITISAGVSSFPKYGKTNSELLTGVDECLYFAKNAGRNRVYSSSQNEPLERDKGKRIDERHQVAIKFSKGVSPIQFIETYVNNRWKMCMLDNISRKRFKGWVEFEFPEINGNLTFRIFSEGDVASHETFNGVVAYKNQITDGRYSIGVNVIDELEKWENLYNKVSI
ncbi:MAG TPA: sensor domain-containing diguanylate cyclase [Nitrospinota bacterium]|nr:sensor domain-containing diguanylate cyclase [Nitrospinota bacterium]